MKAYVTKENKTGGNDSGTATTWGANEQNSSNDELVNVVETTGQTPTVGTGPDTNTKQLARAINIYSQTGHGYQDSGVADAYVLTRTGLLEQPSSYIDSSRITFITANINTGASTVNVSTLGVKKIMFQDGATDLVGGEIKANEFTELIYSSSADGGAGAFLYAPWSGVVQISAPGVAPSYTPRAWVNFNGTGVVAIRASGNVSSITDNGMGDYTVNFTTAMTDADYATVSSCDEPSGTSLTRAATGNPLTTSVDVNTDFINQNDPRAPIDATIINVAVIR